MTCGAQGKYKRANVDEKKLNPHQQITTLQTMFHKANQFVAAN
jgi:hypothetical protein